MTMFLEREMPHENVFVILHDNIPSIRIVLMISHESHDNIPSICNITQQCFKYSSLVKPRAPPWEHPKGAL